MAKKLLKLPDDFHANLKALLGTPPPPAGTPGSRKAAPKVPRGGVRVKGERAAVTITATPKKKRAAKKR